MLQLDNFENISLQLLSVVAARNVDDYNGDDCDIVHQSPQPTKEEFLDALWTLTALLISTEGELFHLFYNICVHFFVFCIDKPVDINIRFFNFCLIQSQKLL
jgi:hypothetical protein